MSKHASSIMYFCSSTEKKEIKLKEPQKKKTANNARNVNLMYSCAESISL
jgi:hypothetical protein